MLSFIRRIEHSIHSYIHFHSRQIGLTGLAILTALVSTFFCFSFKVVSITDGYTTKKLVTLNSDINGILHSAGYVQDFNIKETKEDGNFLSIEIAPTFSVYVTYDQETVSFVTEKCTVAEAIEKSGFTVKEKDMVNLSLDTLLEAEAYIDIVPYVPPAPAVIPAISTQVIPTVSDVNLCVNTNGIISTLVPDIEIPLDENGLPIRYTSVTRVQATAYTYTGNRCSTGVNPQPGYIAVNPKVIPYGTKMYIVSADGKYTYGYAVAADTGGFIQSRPTNVDLFFTTEAACRIFGRRDIYIYFVY